MHCCYVCKSKDKELRPYGEHGQPICHPCMKASPVREREAVRQFRKLEVRTLRAMNAQIDTIQQLSKPAEGDN